MIILPRHFVRFIDGRAGKTIPIAYLPDGLAAQLGTRQTTVALEHSYALKLLRKGWKYQEFGEIQNTIDFGMCIQESYQHLSFFYFKDAIAPEIYFLLLKVAGGGRETWLVTFHRLRQQQINRRLKGAKVIREHYESEFMG